MRTSAIAPSPGGVEMAAMVSETVMILPPASSDGLSPFVKIDLSLLAYPLKSVKRSQLFFDSRLCRFFTQVPPRGSPVSVPLETLCFQCSSRFCHINLIVGQPLPLPNSAHPVPASLSRKRQSTAALQSMAANSTRYMCACPLECGAVAPLLKCSCVLFRAQYFPQRSD